jgi:hypothetical protein
MEPSHERPVHFELTDIEIHGILRECARDRFTERDACSSEQLHVSTPLLDERRLCQAKCAATYRDIPVQKLQNVLIHGVARNVDAFSPQTFHRI